MGWGVEFDWRRLRPEGCLFGIVDAVQINHAGGEGAEYDRHAARLQLRAELDSLGVVDYRELHQVMATWHPWQRTPPWRRTASVSQP
jgi:hypothetical protein